MPDLVANHGILPAGDRAIRWGLAAVQLNLEAPLVEDAIGAVIHLQARPTDANWHVVSQDSWCEREPHGGADHSLHLDILWLCGRCNCCLVGRQTRQHSRETAVSLGIFTSLSHLQLIARQALESQIPRTTCCLVKWIIIELVVAAVD